MFFDGDVDIEGDIEKGRHVITALSELSVLFLLFHVRNLLCAEIRLWIT